MVSQYFFGGTIRAKASLVLGRSVRSATASRRRERTANVRPLLEFASIRTDAIDAVSFLNRDHIILVTINQGEIVVTTTAGTKITIPHLPRRSINSSMIWLTRSTAILSRLLQNRALLVNCY
jgi:hypothetical protein